VSMRAGNYNQASHDGGKTCMIDND